jgi:peptide/nickel transport system permease protein
MVVAVEDVEARQPARAEPSGPSRRLVLYLARRLLFAALLVLFASSAALVLTRLAPGDVTTELVGPGTSAATIARERARAGLDDPVLTQYLRWLWRAARFDFGVSIRYGRPVVDLVAERAGNTLVLASVALLAATLLGVPLGIYTGAHPRGVARSIVRAASFVLVSVPPLLMSLLLLVLAARTGWFPAGGMDGWIGSAGLHPLASLAWHVALPAMAIALPLAAALEQIQSRSMAETLGEPFIRAAAARGLSFDRIVWRHALKIAVRPVAAMYGALIGSLFSGSFAVEIVMSWPGLGRLMYDALLARDLFLVAGCAAAGSVFLAAGAFVSDLVLASIDPRTGVAAPASS